DQNRGQNQPNPFLHACLRVNEYTGNSIARILSKNSPLFEKSLKKEKQNKTRAGMHDLPASRLGLIYDLTASPS
ncbi:MAG: hypothetical protein IIZ49_04025, partial [Oscillospiraceae bacterium]|nr:hypothetical protein [Oscillospiraceae bacterium]